MAITHSGNLVIIAHIWWVFQVQWIIEMYKDVRNPALAHMCHLLAAHALLVVVTNSSHAFRCISSISVQCYALSPQVGVFAVVIISGLARLWCCMGGLKVVFRCSRLYWPSTGVEGH